MPFTVKARDGEDRSLRPDVPADQLRLDEEVSDHQPHLSRAADRQRRRRASSRRRAATRRRWPSWASWWWRSTAWARRCARKKFHDAYYGNMGDNGLPDQIAAMKQLAAALSVDRPRSRGHLWPLRRRLRHGRRDVPLSRLLQGGRLGSRQPRQPRVRGRLGREVAGPAGAQRRTAPPITTIRPTRTWPKNLKGKLLLAHGTMDNNVPPYNTLLVVNELIKANKDFDLIAAA